MLWLGILVYVTFMHLISLNRAGTKMKLLVSGYTVDYIIISSLLGIILHKRDFIKNLLMLIKECALFIHKVADIG